VTDFAATLRVCVLSEVSDAAAEALADRRGRGVLAGGLGAGRLGLLQGSPPSDLGVREGRLKPPATSPNSISSQAAQ
jgi:hypothetical protein